MVANFIETSDPLVSQNFSMHTSSSVDRKMQVRSDADTAPLRSPCPGTYSSARYENVSIPPRGVWTWAKHGNYDWMNEHSPFISEE